MPRKEKKTSLPTNWLLFVGVVCLFLAAAPCGYVWNKTQIHTLGGQIRGYESRLEAAKLKRQSLDRTWATMLSYTNLDDRVRRMSLEIGPPQPDQIVRLPETLMPATATPQDEKLYAHRKSSTEEGRD
jgi:hypothetical protein